MPTVICYNYFANIYVISRIALKSPVCNTYIKVNAIISTNEGKCTPHFAHMKVSSFRGKHLMYIYPALDFQQAEENAKETCRLAIVRVSSITWVYSKTNDPLMQFVKNLVSSLEANSFRKIFCTNRIFFNYNFLNIKCLKIKVVLLILWQTEEFALTMTQF